MASSFDTRGSQQQKVNQLLQKATIDLHSFAILSKEKKEGIFLSGLMKVNLIKEFGKPNNESLTSSLGQELINQLTLPMLPINSANVANFTYVAHVQLAE